MAANEYYNDSSRRYNNYEPSLASTVPPSYTSQPPHNHDRPGASTVSPFETVFDDHVYPTNSHSHQTPDSLNTSQQNFAYDTRYHGPAPGDVSPVGTDEIPLRQQNKPPGFTADSNDHVYDTPDPEPGRRGPPKRGLLRFGEMGMLGSEKRRIPIMVYLFSLIQIVVFIVELVKAAQLTGSPIQTQPQFNPMIGPSQQVLINMGSRFVPCMKNVDGVQNYHAPAGTQGPGFGWPCPNTTSLDPNNDSNKCSLSELCGFDGVPNPEWDHENGLKQNPAPNQWFRFIIPIFMHAGIIHIGFNLLLQLTMGKEIERAIGSTRFFLVYMSAGIFGFVMGGNYAAPGISSTGASGSLFGIIAITLLDLLYSWGERRNPGRELIFIVIEILISFALGLLPGLDNFSHIGGFIVGLCLGVSVLHSPNVLRRRIGEDHFGGPSYSSVGGGITSVAFPSFYRNPVGFFKGRKPLWWVWWLVRAGFLILVIVVFIVLLQNFYNNQNSCSWCKYLSCLPVNNWCDIGNLTISTAPSPTPSTSPRSIDLFPLEQVANFYS
ncbi:rhomboid-domain-containing protein [Hypomontagnella submonticulosa]|nr:rhomboid-domain-containing protein [Hypomontagnella submonticulosa]